MGCSPSKGQLFIGAAGPHSSLPSASEVDHLLLNPGERENPGSGTDEGANGLPLPADEEPSAMAPGPVAVSGPEDATEVEVNLESQERDVPQGEQLTAEKRTKEAEERRTIKGSKPGTLRGKERKAELPARTVKAHQAACAYLDPNISKYETLLGLLDQAARTQLSLRPAMAAMALRVEDVNQALEEMAEEGELMLKEHGDHMAWPSGMRALPPAPTKPSVGTAGSSDLLQHLLRRSAEKMRLVGSSFHGPGVDALEEAVGYFSSLSKLLGERLRATRAAEGRLARVLACVEAAAGAGAVRRKSALEDSALYSEDSGIGGESESLAGSDRCRRHRGSSGSGGSAQAAPHGPPNQVCLNEGEEEEEEEEDDYEDEEDEKEEGERGAWRKRSNSSPPDPSRPVLPAPPKHGRGRAPRRPLTAAPTARPARPRPSQSADCLGALLELRTNQRHMEERMEKMAARAEGGGRSVALCRVGLRSQSSAPRKTPSSLPPAFAPQQPGCHSVKRLINTFSGRPGQSLANLPPHASRRKGAPLLPDIWAAEGVFVNNGNNNNNGWSAEGREYVDADSLPPPPPEVLMDDSFQSTAETPRGVEGLEEDPGKGRPAAPQRSGVSQRLRASVQNVAVLPNRGGVRHGHLSGADGAATAAEARRCQGPERPPEADPDLEKEEAAHLYRQARKIIHLRNAAEDQGPRGPSPLRAGVGLRPGNGDYCQAETYACSHRPTTPPASRVRLPPSCASAHHRLHSPPAPKDQPGPPSQTRPSSSSGQWRSPSCPGSPRIQRWARENSGEQSSSAWPSASISFCDARAVFCQNSPPPWGDSLPARRPQTSVRRSQSDRRPSATTRGAEVPQSRATTQVQSQGTEPSVINSTDRVNSASVTEEDSQSNPSAGAPSNLNLEGIPG